MKVTVIAAGFDSERGGTRRPLAGIDDSTAAELPTPPVNAEESPEPDGDDDLEIPGFVQG